MLPSGLAAAVSLLRKMSTSGPLWLFAQTAGTRLLGMASSSLLVVLLARALDPDHYGVYALFTTTYVFGNLILGFNLSGNLIRRIPGADTAHGARLLATFVLTEVSIGAALLLLAITLGFDRWMASALEIPQYLTEFRLILLMTWVDLGAGGCLNYLLARKRFGAANGLTLLRASLLGPLLALVWLFGRPLDIQVICTTWLVGSIISLLFGLTVTDLWRGLRQGFDGAALQGAFRFGVMLASQSFAFYFLKLADRYVLAHYSTLRDIGIYSFAYTLSNIAYSLSALVIVGLFQPHIVEAHNRADIESRDQLLGQLTRTSLTAVLAASMVAAVVAPYAILLARPGYGDSATVLPWLLLTLIPVVAAYPASTVLMLEGKLWASLVGGALAIAVSVPINLVLVPRISYRGSLIASAVGFSVLALVQHSVARTWRFLGPTEFRKLPHDLRALLRGTHRTPPPQ